VQNGDDGDDNFLVHLLSKDEQVGFSEIQNEQAGKLVFLNSW
jgi:hypothetical protein